MNKLKMHSPDLTQANIDKLAELFPNCVVAAADTNAVVKRSIDFDQLRQELSDSIVEGSHERYQLNWPGKREAQITANAPIAKTLRPSRDESVDFDTTQNLFIEGDNLDALKLLQETYLNKIKMIYIDPPYNTGSDLIYEDDFAEDSAAYLERSLQTDSMGNRMVANTDSNGRFHSDWLTMMYPRLKLARNLLSDNGAIFISIGDNEVANLKKMCDELYGESNYVGTFVWRRRASSALANRLVSTDHEYVVVYQKGNFTSLGIAKDFNNYTNPDNDPRGPWVAGDLTVGMGKDLRPNQFYELTDPSTGKMYQANPNRVWAYIPTSMNKLIEEKRVLFPEDTNRRPMLKRFKSELKSGVNPVSTWVTDIGLNTEGTKELQQLFGQTPFDYSKPVSLLSHLIKTTVEIDEIFLDFFAGSGTAAHALMQIAAEDQCPRPFICVQLPEPTDRGEYPNIAEVCKERIRRAGKKIKQEYAGRVGIDKLDIGFRVLKIDSSNMKDVFYTPDAVAQDHLFDQVNNIREDRTPEDLLFQVLLDWGVDLALPIVKETIEGKAVYFVDGSALAACFDEGVSEDFVKLLAKREPLRMVFRDAGFATDSVKINVEQIFKLMSPSTEVKTI
jgi:adenine-specific DNA-methyltransferase